MAEPVRRGVTRGYVAGLLSAVLVVALAVLVAGWGGFGLATGREPVSVPHIPTIYAPAVVGVCLVLLAWSLWRQAIVLLKGRTAPSWGLIIATGVAAYLIWSFFGTVAMLTLDDTWMSPFALILAVICVLASFLFWAILVRRVYTNRPTPKWPWERDDDRGPDWVIYGETPWESPPRPGDEDGRHTAAFEEGAGDARDDDWRDDGGEDDGSHPGGPDERGS